MRAALSRLKELVQKSPRATQPAAVQPGVRIYAIGDIHGRSDLLRRLHGQIEADAASLDPAVKRVAVYLGDYVDRGLDSKGVVDILLSEPLAGFEAVHLKGNHEDFMLRFMQDPAVGPQWFANGGDATLLSYGVRTPKGMATRERLEHLSRELRERVPAAHRDFLQNLGLMYEAQDYVFVHAGVHPGRPLDQQDPDDLIWIREEFLHGSNPHGKVVVHGHSPEREPGVHPHRIGIDTGAFATNILTCVVLQGTSQRFLATR